MKDFVDIIRKQFFFKQKIYIYCFVQESFLNDIRIQAAHHMSLFLLQFQKFDYITNVHFSGIYNGKCIIKQS